MTTAHAGISVLIVDDSPTARAVLVEVCRRDPVLRVVGQAASGHEAVALATRLQPTLVLMDITMPDLDGYEATREIMTVAPTRIVMVTAANDPKSVEVTLRALEAGALTVLAKPADALAQGPDSDEFVRRVKLLADVGVIRRHAPRMREAGGPGAARTAPARPGILAIATSTGGPQALQGLFDALPVDFPLPVVAVQHIVGGFVPGLASWLNIKVGLRVKVAVQGERLQPGTVYLAPDNQHLTVSRRHAVALTTEPPIGGFRPSGTALLASVAQVYGPDAIGVILTGMGDDGLEGARALSDRGGTVLAQDEASSVVFGMPGAVVTAGLADAVGPVELLAQRIRQLTSRRPL
jgi:two-component system chemotaxis response regulator CheB